MTLGFWTQHRVAGALLAASLLVSVLSLVITITSGAIAGFGPLVRGSLKEAAPYAASFRLPTLLFAIGWIVQLIGLSLLARLLARAGAEQLAVAAFTLVFVAVIVAFLYSTFQMSVELWATQEAARAGGVPEIFRALHDWVSDTFRIAYGAHLLAMAGFGIAILRTGLLGPGVGWATIGWCTLWFVGILLGAGIPALPIIMPAVIGVAMLRE